MPSYKADLFNTDPYYDDFSEDKKFLRIMFRPGYGVQARELTQLQTILQNQIERLGSHVFDEGSIVLGGKVTVNSLKYARVNSLSGTTDINDFIGLVSNNANRAKVRIVHAETGLSSSSVDNLPIIFYDYLQGGTGFTFGDVLGVTAADGAYITATITGTNTGLGPYPIGNSLVVSVDEGVRFAEGFFIYHDPQSVGVYSLSGSAGNAIRYYDSPTSRVGFNVVRGFVDADADSTLNDPAYGSYNYNAPGADRYKIDLVLSQYGYTATNTSATENFSRTDFIEFLRLVSGSPVKIEKYPDYAALEDTLARRTYDESGNYTVRPFELNLVDGPGITTDDENSATIYADLEPGKAYIFGYECETQGTTRLSLDAARGSDHLRTLENVDFNRDVGPTTRVVFSGITGSLNGFAGFTSQPMIYLSRGTSGTALDLAGTARIRSIYQPGAGTGIYDVGLYNVELSGTASFGDITRIFVGSTGPTHAFSLTGSAGLQYTQYGDLLYQIPSGTRCARIGDGSGLGVDFTIFGFSSRGLTSSGGGGGSYVGAGGKENVSTSGYSTFEIRTSEFGFPDNAYCEFGINTTDFNLNSNSQITVFDLTKGSPISGTGHRNNDDSIQLTLSGVTAGQTIGISTDIQITKLTTSDFLKTKYLITESITSGPGGFTGVFGGLTFSSYAGSTAAANQRVLYFGGKVDIAEVISLTGTVGGTPQQIKSYFAFDSGQRDNLYDWSRMVLLNNAPTITGPYSATVRRFGHTGSYGVFTVGSYGDPTIKYSDIPDYTSKSTGIVYNLADVIDFRPVRGPSGNINSIPFIPTPNSQDKYTYTHYLPRTDKIVLTRDRVFDVIRGIPSVDAIMPPDNPNAMTLYSVTMNPYTYDKKDTTTRFVENRRYTMRDIGELEKRVEAVEYYTTLSLLEQEAKAISIVDDTGVEIPKKGILVDQFKGHNIGDVTNSMYAAAIDFEKNELRPPFESRAFGLSGPVTATYISNGITASTDGIVTINYSTSSEIVQPLTTTTAVVNPSNVFNYLGTLKLSPSGDFWFDTSTTPSVRVNVDGENDSWQAGAGFGSQWNDWESIWYGREPTTESNTKLNITTKNSVMAGTKGLNLGNTFKSGVPEGFRRKTQTKTVRKDVIPYLRDKNIYMSAKGLKPNTRFYVFLDDVNITAYCTGTSQDTDSNGEINGLYYQMSGDSLNAFLTGRRVFRITDSSTNSASEATMSADAIYNASGMVDNLAEDGVLSTRPAIVRRRSVKSNKIQSNLIDMLSTDFFGFTEPLSQTFMVDPVKYPDGVFVKKVGISFSSKDSIASTPVTLLLKPTVSGYPHPCKVMPFGESTVYSSNITTSTDGSTETIFSFSSPIYLLPGAEYSISLFTNSIEFGVHKAIIGDNIIKTNDSDDDLKATKQPMVRSLFTPQNSGSLKKTDVESLKFSVHLCKFTTGSTPYAYYEDDGGGYADTTYFDLMRVNLNHIIPTNCTLTFAEQGLLRPSGFTTFQENKNIDRPTLVGVRNKGVGTRSVIKMNFTGTQYVSPVIDAPMSNYVVVKNLVNSNSDTSTNGELLPNNLGAASPTLARYITKQVTLESGFEATDAHVQMSMCNPVGSTVRVYIRPLSIGETDSTNVGWQSMSPSSSDTIGYSNNPDDFREISFNASSLNLSEFRSFAIKVVMLATNPAAGVDPRILPRIKNLRIIAT